MPDKPSAEVTIDEALVRRLLVSQATSLLPEVSSLPLRKVAEGWDSEVWRLGRDHAVRLARRALAAPLIEHEHRSLPALAPALEATGIRVPLPLLRGVPAAGYPWAWSVVPWIDGRRGLDVPRPDRAPWAARLAAALGALHRPAPADHPVNPVRGGPLGTRADAFAQRTRDLAVSGRLDEDSVRALTGVWHRGLAAPPWESAPLWIHGDLHPGNLVASEDALAGIIDFGDVTAGDPAYDLAVAWLAFDAGGRSAFVAATDGRYDAATWTRAHAWAAAVAVLLLAHSDDNPDYAALGAESVSEVMADAAPVSSSER